MEKNSGFKYACGWNKFTFELLGLWPTKLTFLGKYYALMNVVLIWLVIVIPRSIGFYFYRNELDAIIQSLGNYLIFIVTTVKLISLHYRREVFSEFLEIMENDWSMPFSKEKFNVMIRFAKIGRFVSIFSGCISYTSNSFGIIAQKLYNIEKSHIKHPDPRLTTNLFWIVYLPYDTTTTISYIVSLLLQLYTSVFGALVYFTFDSFIVMLVLHLCGQLALIQISIRHLSDAVHMSNSQYFRTELGGIVRKHEKLIRLATDLEDSFHFVLILHLLGSTLMFCFQGYGVLALLHRGSLNIFQLLFSGTVVLAVVLHFFFCCWAGEFLIFQSTSMGYAIYESEWYRLPHGEARSLILIGLKKFRPLTLTTGKFSILSLNLFMTVTKSSMTYLSMLLAVQGRKI